MIRNLPIVQSFEQAFARQEAADFRRHLRIFEALFSEARSLCVIPLKEALDGRENDIRLAGVFNARGVTPSRINRA